MGYIRAFGRYLPERVVTSEEVASWVRTDAAWIRNVSGIEERRFAADGESVTSMGVAAAKDCLASSGLDAASIGLVLVSSGSAERQFPGPASEIAAQLGCGDAPAIDLPVASAGGLFGMVLASRLTTTMGRILVVAAEKMSAVVQREPLERGVAILFGDGAGACLIDPEMGDARIVESALHSDGSYASDLALEFGKPLAMNGRSVIMQASRKIPSVIQEVLAKASLSATEIPAFLMHQANQNLIDRVAQALGVPATKFYSNIRRYGNTSSASLLIAACEWWRESGFPQGQPVVFSAFGAGFHWGALLARGC